MTALDTATEREVYGTAVAAPEAPVGRTTAWWGMVLFIATEAMTFGCFLASYFYLRFDHGGSWPPAADKLPDLLLPSLATGMLILGCGPMWLSGRAARRGTLGPLGTLLLVTLGFGIAFIVFQGLDYAAEWPSSTVSKDAYGSLFFLITGLHALHVLAGLAMLLMLLASTVVGRIGAKRPEPVGIVALYWYFLAVIAVAIYLTVYISPYL